MKQARAGRIINISSGAGLQASLTGIQAYCSAKHAVIGLTRQLAHELGPFGITVNSVAPGFIRTNPRHRAAVGELRRRTGRRRSWSASRCSTSAPPRTSPTRCCSSPPTSPASSAARSSRWTAADEHGLGPVDAWMEANKPRLLEELLGFLAVASVSTDPAYAAGIEQAAALLAARLEGSGCADVRLLDGGGHKAVVRRLDRCRRASRRLSSTAIMTCSRPCRWASGNRRRSSPTHPRRPHPRARRFRRQVPAVDRARGDRGVARRARALPVNVKLLLEGEEEIGSRRPAGNHGRRARSAEGGCADFRRRRPLAARHRDRQHEQPRQSRSKWW